jgi:hypothetical protein
MILQRGQSGHSIAFEEITHTVLALSVRKGVICASVKVRPMKPMALSRDNDTGGNESG